LRITRERNGMNETLVTAVPWIGGVAAVMTTICWLPQAVQVVRYKDTRAISLTTNLILAAGLVLWLIYGIAIADWPLIGSDAISIVFTSVIVAMKLRYG
jgi:MtN3 and saliva related transmembrane protein